MQTQHENAVAAYREAHAASGKYRRNVGKMQFMDFANNGMLPFGTQKWVADLELMEAESSAASMAFAASVEGMTTEEIVAVIEEAGAGA